MRKQKREKEITRKQKIQIKEEKKKNNGKKRKLCNDRRVNNQLIEVIKKKEEIIEQLNATENNIKAETQFIVQYKCKY